MMFGIVAGRKRGIRCRLVLRHSVSHFGVTKLPVPLRGEAPTQSMAKTIKYLLMKKPRQYSTRSLRPVVRREAQDEAPAQSSNLVVSACIAALTL